MMNYPKFRLFLGSLIGSIIIFGLSFASERLAQAAFQREDPWAIIFWSDHYIFRFVSAMVSLALGGVTVGFIARRYGGTLSALAAMPTFICLILGILAIYPDWGQYGWGNLIMLIAWSLLILPGAFLFGKLGEKLVEDLWQLFDSRKNCFLGIKWYHYFWLTITMIYSYALVLILVGEFFRGLNYIPEAWDIGILRFLGSIFTAGLFLVILSSGTKLILYSFINGMMLLAGWRNDQVFQKPILGSLFYLIGVPITLNLSLILGVFLLSKIPLLGIVSLAILVSFMHTLTSAPVRNVESALETFMQPKEVNI